MSKFCLFKLLALFIEYQRVYLLLFINKPLQSNDYAIPLGEFFLNKYSNKYL